MPEKSLALFLKGKQGIRSSVVSNFYLGLKKMSVIWKIWNFHPSLKFHLWLPKQSWNFNAVYRVEILKCNCNVTLKRRLLFSWDETSTRYAKMKITLIITIIITIIIIIIIIICIIFIIIIITFNIIIIIIIELIHRKAILENTAETEPQPFILDF